MTQHEREISPWAEIVVVTVAVAGADSATIILPGTTTATQKAYRYAVNGMQLTAGDRVYAIKVSGTYVLLGGTISGSGSPGATFTPTVSAEGVISWTNDGGLPNPTPVNIKGPKGDGMYAFEVRADGHLWCIYDTDTAPAFRINSSGHLIYTMGD